jgi:hypothetical protein
MNATNPKEFIHYQNLIEQLQRTEPGSKGSEGEANNELANQFIPFQIVGNQDKNLVQQVHEIDPLLEGKEDRPDVLMRVEMIDFHLAEDERLNKRDRATMNITIRQENAVDDKLEPLYWVASAGLDLYDIFHEKDRREKVKTDLHEVFSRRPIELPNGVGVLKFDVIKHREKRWYDFAFDIFNSKIGKTAVFAFGLPGVAIEAAGIVKNLFDKLKEKNAEVLFDSMEMPLVFTKAAKDRMLKDNAHNMVGAIQPGMFLLARGRDFERFKGQSPFYHYTYQKLYPQGTTQEQMMDPDFIDPFKNCTYALFRVAMVDAKLNPAYEELKF